MKRDDSKILVTVILGYIAMFVLGAIIGHSFGMYQREDLPDDMRHRCEARCRPNGGVNEAWGYRQMLYRCGCENGARFNIEDLR